MKKFGLWAGLFLFTLTLNIFGQPTPPPVTVRLQPFLTGLSSPVLIRSAKDGTRRLFIVQQGGIIKVVQPGSTTPTDFMNITTRVLSGGERGLLGLAFHPNFATNGYFFVNYTRQTDGATVVSRFRAINNNTAGDPNSELPLLTIPQPFSNHNGGMIEFRTDNGVHNLYVGMGDGGSGNDPGNRAQNINELLGKFLRITPDVSGSPTAPAYTVPADNPFVGANGADEIYAVGVRNPWRWSFDRGGTNQLWAGDVGQGSIEEVDVITRGGNFGWRVYEGTQCTGIDPGLCTPGNYIAPVFQYSSASPSPRCSVTGGYVYRGARRTLPDGAYVYADYCTGEIWMWNNNQQIPLIDTSRNISSFGEDDAGEIYVVGLGGTIEKLVRPKAPADFDGDGKTDISVWRAPSGSWWYLHSSDLSGHGHSFGLADDIITPGDFTGDGKWDVAVWRPSTGEWFVRRSEDGSYFAYSFGLPGDIPAPADYDGDGITDTATFRPSTATWYIFNSGSGTFGIVTFGLDGDKPVPADFDGDGKADIATWRPSNGTWWIVNSSNLQQRGYGFGLGTDKPVVGGDYTGDGKADIALWRPSTSEWFFLRSEDGSYYSYPSGLPGDIPAPGDYDGDGRFDSAVFRPSTVTWYIDGSTSGAMIATFGLNGDRPVTNAFVP